MTAAAQTPAEVPDAVSVARRAAAAGGRGVDVAALPLLSASPVGRRFLALAPPRALAQGAPPEICPALTMAGGAPAPDAAALGACLDALADRPGCGCRLLARDDVALAGPGAFAYAPGVGGRLVGLTRALGPLVVEEHDIGRPGVLRVVFYDAGGAVAAADLAEDGAARLILLPGGARYAGLREPRGWRRGRLTERLLLTGADGARLIALIGFEPADLAAEGPALAAWPRPGGAKG